MKLLLWVNDKGPFKLNVRDDQRFLIGRDEVCDFTIDNDSISRKHTVLELLSGELFIRDYESYNGTILNGKIISDPVPLYLPAEVYLGPDVRLNFEQLREKKPLNSKAKADSKYYGNPKQKKVLTVLVATLVLIGAGLSLYYNFFNGDESSNKPVITGN